jgi:hypothetical protein
MSDRSRTRGDTRRVGSRDGVDEFKQRGTLTPGNVCANLVSMGGDRLGRGQTPAKNVGGEGGGFCYFLIRRRLTKKQERKTPPSEPGVERARNVTGCC